MSMRACRSVVRFAVFVALLSGCADGGLSAATETDLQSAQDTWRGAGISDYQLVVTSGPNMISPDGCEWSSAVRGDNVETAEVLVGSEFGCLEIEWSAERLHALVAELVLDLRRFESPEFGQHTMRVEYNETGVPTVIEYDLANGDDEELSYRIAFSMR